MADRKVINERYSVRERGPFKFAAFPPHIFEGATDYYVRVGPIGVNFAGRTGRSNTVIRVGRRCSIVIERAYNRVNSWEPDGEHEWKAYITIAPPDSFYKED